MSRRVFLSFRYSDGVRYKKKLDDLFDSSKYIINCSESVDRSGMSEATIKNYLYGKLNNTSVTVVIITPQAVEYKKIYSGNYNDWIYDDWIYDEVKYSLDDRTDNRTNGIVAVYTESAKPMVVADSGETRTILRFNNLVRKNMLNIKPKYKHNDKIGIYDSHWDSYCSLVSWDRFVNNYEQYIEEAAHKREFANHYNIVKRM